MVDQREIIRCDDGSFTIRSALFNECYHSRNGALAESFFIFIRNGFDYFIENITDHEYQDIPSSAPPFRRVHILEAGFGTGLNALLTALRVSSEKRVPVEYSAVELYPLTVGEAECLNYPQAISQDESFSFYPGAEEADAVFRKIHQAEWGATTEITPFFSINKIRKDLLSMVFPSDYFQIVYFDMFSPGVHPQVWEKAVLERIFSSLKPDGIFITYSSKGEVKRNLRECGFTVSRLKGPEGKRHIVRAVKPS